jgi:hypothetical protein
MPRLATASHRRDRQKVMQALNLMVAAGLAGWSGSDTGHTLFILNSGEVFELHATHLRRVR